MDIAKEFLNFKRAEIQKKSLILDAAKNSVYFDTNRAFFNDVTHRKNNNRMQPWVKKVEGAKHQSYRGGYASNQNYDAISESSSSIMNSELASQFSSIHSSTSNFMNPNVYNMCNGKTRLLSNSTQKVIINEYYTTNISLNERVCFTHLRQPDYLTL